jgi:hypothetical protein
LIRGERSVTPKLNELKRGGRPTRREVRELPRGGEIDEAMNAETPPAAPLGARYGPSSANRRP